MTTDRCLHRGRNAHVTSLSSREHSHGLCLTRYCVFSKHNNTMWVPRPLVISEGQVNTWTSETAHNNNAKIFWKDYTNSLKSKDTDCWGVGARVCSDGCLQLKTNTMQVTSISLSRKSLLVIAFGNILSSIKYKSVSNVLR